MLECLPRACSSSQRVLSPPTPAAGGCSSCWVSVGCPSSCTSPCTSDAVHTVATAAFRTGHCTAPIATARHAANVRMANGGLLLGVVASTRLASLPRTNPFSPHFEKLLVKFFRVTPIQQINPAPRRRIVDEPPSAHARVFHVRDVHPCNYVGVTPDKVFVALASLVNTT